MLPLSSLLHSKSHCHFFCSSYKIIDHDPSNCRQLHSNVISNGEKIVSVKIQLYHLKLVGVHDENKGSISYVLKLVEAIVQPVVSLF